MHPTPIIIGLQLVAALVFFPGLLLWLSGDWRWVEGWIFGVWWVSLGAAILLWLHYRDPALYAERFRMPGSGGESRSDLAILIELKVCAGQAVGGAVEVDGAGFAFVIGHDSEGSAIGGGDGVADMSDGGGEVGPADLY